MWNMHKTLLLLKCAGLVFSRKRKAKLFFLFERTTNRQTIVMWNWVLADIFSGELRLSFQAFKGKLEF